MYDTKEEIAQQLEHQRKLLRIRRANLQALQLQEANYGISPPLDLINQLNRLTEQVRETDAEIIRLKSLAAEDQLSLVEAEYRVLLAEIWNTPHGRPSVAGIAKLELVRLRLGLAPERAQELENEIRTQLVEEVFDTLDIPILLGLESRINFNRFDQEGVRIQVDNGGQVTIQELIVTQQIQMDNPLVTAYKRLACAIRLDSSITLRLFLQILPPEPKLELSTFGPQLLSINQIVIHPEDNQIFTEFLTKLADELTNIS